MLTTWKKSRFRCFAPGLLYDPIHLHKFDKHLVTNAPANSTASAVVYKLFEKKKKEKGAEERQRSRGMKRFLEVKVLN